MIVERERPEPVEDLIEEILRMDLLHDFSVDPIPYAKQAITVNPMNSRRNCHRDAGDQAAILPVVRAARSDERHRAPGASAPAHRPDQHVALDRGIGVTDVAREHTEVPVAVLGQREQ